MTSTVNTQLQQQYENLKSRPLLELFKTDPSRAQEFYLEVDGLSLDFSKNHLTPETLSALCSLAEGKKLPQAIKSLFKGEEVNHTEHRPALHTALREPANASDTSAIVQAALDKMSGFVEQIHKQQWLGYSGKAITDIVNIGIGGSDLGPRMVAQALSAYHLPQVKVSFVANIDGADLEDTLSSLDPATTLFIIASKTFTTLETLNNAMSARSWTLDSGCSNQDLHKHFVAISSNIKAAKDFGIEENNIFPMWDWVGGRYSLWSAIGLPIALAIGMDGFKALLSGAHTMDKHFTDAPLQKNMPVVAALITYWYSHYWGTSSQAVLPYAQRLSRLPAYLQQLDMESLGKQVYKDGSTVTEPTGQVVWGTEGTNGQHSFHQLLHQGTQLIPVDFIAVKQAMSHLDKQHDYLLACCLSQSQALLQGKSLTQAELELSEQGLSKEEIDILAPHKLIPGNRPNNMLIIEKLTPKNLGALIAFYEHKVYAHSILLDINAYDQWGVELGKQLGTPLYEALSSGAINNEWDSSTQHLIKKLTTNKK